MKTRFTKAIALGLAGGIVAGNSAICALAEENPTQQSTEIAKPTDTAEALEKAARAEEETTEYAAAGISVLLDQYYSKTDDSQNEILDMLTPAKTEETKKTEKKAKYEKKREAYFKNLAIAKVDTYVNIRKKPNTESKVVGHIYGNCSAKIIDRVDGWYKIQSGNVIGYTKADYFLTGTDAEEYAFNNGYVLARCNVEGLYVRKKKSTNSKILTMIANGEKYAVVDKTKEWAKVALDDDTEGWISMKYVDIRACLDKAVTLKEERQIQKEQERKQREEAESISESVAASQSAEAASIEATQQDEQQQQPTQAQVQEEQQVAQDNQNDYEQVTQPTTVQQYVQQETQKITQRATQKATQKITTPQTTTLQQIADDSLDQGSSSVSGVAVVAYAKRFLGNPYVYGGSSLTNGTDCSGFTMSVYAHFGYSLNRSSAAQRSNGVSVPLNAVQPGDLICYNGHVALYIGGGQIIHASTPSTGIIISSMYYGSTPICARRIIQ